MSIHPALTSYKSFRDPIFGQIELTKKEVEIVDTVEFQALQRIAQLGTVQYVFRSAKHTREAHMIQTCYLAGEMLHNLQRNHKRRFDEVLKLDFMWIESVRIAGLIHDIGQSVLSHYFDHIAKDLGIVEEMQDHESRGILLFRHMCKKYHFAITQEQQDLICALVIGTPREGYPAFLFEIVANHFCELDVDKFSYLLFDSWSVGFARDIQIQRIFQHIYVINDHVIYDEKVAQLLFDILALRKRMHREVYRHHTTIRVELLQYDRLRLVFEAFNLKDLINNYQTNNHAWREILTDDLFHSISMHHKMPHLFQDDQNKKELINRAYDLGEKLAKRQFYPESSDGNGNDSKDVDSTLPALYPAPHVFLTTVKCGYSGSSTNPLDQILCERRQKGQKEAGSIFSLSKAKFFDVKAEIHIETFEKSYQRN